MTEKDNNKTIQMTGNKDHTHLEWIILMSRLWCFIGWSWQWDTGAFVQTHILALRLWSNISKWPCSGTTNLHGYVFINKIQKPSIFHSIRISLFFRWKDETIISNDHWVCASFLSHKTAHGRAHARTVSLVRLFSTLTTTDPVEVGLKQINRLPPLLVTSQSDPSVKGSFYINSIRRC